MFLALPSTWIELTLHDFYEVTIVDADVTHMLSNYTVVNEYVLIPSLYFGMDHDSVDVQMVAVDRCNQQSVPRQFTGI